MIPINERGLTSTDWTVYNEGTKRTRCSTEPASNITAETVMVDGFTLSQKDTTGITTRPLVIRKSGTWYCYGWDLTKNICEVFGSNGYINTIYTYTPYGAVTSSGSTVQPLQWSSEYSDTELGLVYYNYRHYNPSDGRWLMRDPIGEGLGVSMYAYIENQAIENSDFLGLVIDTVWDVGNMLWDVGSIVTGAVTGNSELMMEGATDLAFDTAAAIIPGVPAGASKIARNVAKRGAKRAKTPKSKKKQKKMMKHLMGVGRAYRLREH